MSKRKKSGKANSGAKPSNTRSPNADGPEPSQIWVAGVLLLLAAGPMAPGESAAEIGGHLFWGLGWLLLLAIAPTLAILRRRSLEVPWQGADLLLISGAIWMAGAAAWGGLSANPRAGFNMAWYWVGAAACYVALRNAFHHPRWQRMGACLMLGAAAGLALHGTTQFAVTMPAMVRQYEQSTEQERQETLRDMGVDPAADSPSRVQFENRLRSTEPYATFALANSLAGVLAPWLVVWVGLALLPGASRRLVIVSLLTATVLGGCLLLTKSRTGVLAATAGLGALLLWDLCGARRLGWKLPTAIAVAGALLLLVGIAVGALDKEVVTQAALSLAYRWEYWEATLAMVADHPWLGCGSGSFQDYYGQYRALHASELIAEPHNFVLELAACGGVIAAGLWSAAWLIKLAAAATMPREANGPEEPSTGVGGIAPFGGAAIGIVMGMMLAMILGFPPEMLGPLPLAVLCGLVGIALAAWTYREVSAVAAGSWRSWLAVVAPVALATSLLNLLAAGGVSFWGVLQSTLVLTILCNVTADRSVSLRSQAGQLGAAAVPLTLALALALNGVNPLLRLQAAVYQLRATRSPAAAQTAYSQAQVADRWSGLPAQIMAQARCGQRQWDETTWSLFAEALSLDQRNHQLQTEWADQQLRASDFGQDQSMWERAVQHYRAAAELTPRGPAWARLAWALRFGDAADESMELARQALEWHRNHPHREQQLDRLRLPTADGDITALEGCRTILEENT